MLEKMNDLDLIYRKKKDKMGLKAKAKEIIIIMIIIWGLQICPFSVEFISEVIA